MAGLLNACHRILFRSFGHAAPGSKSHPDRESLGPWQRVQLHSTGVCRSSRHRVLLCRCPLATAIKYQKSHSRTHCAGSSIQPQFKLYIWFVFFYRLWWTRRFYGRCGYSAADWYNDGLSFEKPTLCAPHHINETVYALDTPPRMNE